MMDASGVEGEEEVGGERALLLPAGMFLASGGGGGGVEGGAPSSEQEAMNSVASGIAASLNLADANGHHQTVILLDGSGSELVFEPGNAVVLQPAPQDGSTVAAGCTEYIVPEVQSLEGGLPEGTSIIVVPPDSQLTSDQLTAEETVLTTETSDTVGTPADQLASDDNSAAVVEEDKCMNIVEEACKRETIIIETSSVLGATTEVLHEQNGGDSVIVSGPRLTQQSRLDLASDWDDVESDSRGDGSDCRGDVVQRPSRATFDGVEEAILPDMI
ncbi:hypothetical protein LSTR_LSTR007893 [Laodelphax striatellus]|uniref:Uncharacterized protein n=1 Tax=Laodelphax striatellus TaxID=195883 RepID=A0A482WXP4_LAOST|nr:hypothetical protein LSTR_LSTR007893 [Laodelphax striatellus]